MYVYFLLNQLTVGQILIDTELIEKNSILNMRISLKIITKIKNDLY